MLRFICGVEGTGKSVLLRKKLTEAASRGKNTIYIVPDQFSFEAEKLIYRTVPHEFSRRCRVTMFSREAQRLLKTYGETKPYADDIAKRIIIKLALEEVCSEGGLEYYRGQAEKEGFPAFALNVISDMRGAGISPSELRSRLAAENTLTDVLARKLNDISLIYSAYDRILALNFDDKLDDVRRASELATDTDEYSGSMIFIDEFDSFSGSQLGFIHALLDKAEEVTVALTCDWPDCNDRRYEAVNRLIGKIAGDREKQITVLKERFREPSELRVIKARDSWQECDWICAEIRSLMDSGVRCREIAVISPDIGSTRILGSAMKRYDIPLFADIPEPLITRSFVRFCIYTLKALSFETDDLLRYIKSGYVRGADGTLLTDEYTDALEMLCRAFDMRKRDWLRPFPADIDTVMHLRDKGITRDILEGIRKSVINPLVKLKKDFENADGAEMTRLLCDLLCSGIDIRGALYGRCITGRTDEGKPLYSREMLAEMSELWDDTITVFESAYKALAGHVIPLKEYTEILTDIFSSVTISKPPQTLDAVTVGDTSRSRFPAVKYVFIRGFSRGIMPPPAVLPEAFTASESEQLADLGIPVASDRLTRYSEELFTVSRCVNLPSVRLYITYPLTGTDGRTLEPSPAVSELMEERNITAEGADSFGAEHYARTPETAGRYLAHIYRDRSRSGERRALLRRVSREFADMLYSVSGEKPDCDRHIISRSDASALFKFRSFSPTAINLLNNCKFGFFCRYGLGLNEYNDRDIEPALVGSVIHFCLQKLLGDYSGRRGEFLELSEEAINAHVASSITEYEKKAYFDGFGGSQRFSYLLQRLGRYAVISAVRIRDELGMSGFYPEALEKWLSFPFGGITLSGVCDRIDTMTLDGKKYIRVIDYKHSSRDFSLDDIYRGENIQTLLYLFGICSMEKNAVPSSVLYLPVGKLTYDRSDGSDITKKTRDSLQKYMLEHSPAGLILSDSPENAELDAINSELDRKFGVKKNGYIAPVKVSGDEYRAIEAYCDSYLGSKVNEVMSGMVSACPSGSKACTYCGFSVFCGHRAAGTPTDR